MNTLGAAPLVSIIMPAFNAEKFIRVSIESLLSQTYQNFELLVVNDASVDSTCKIVSEYAAKDRRIRLLNNCKGKGVAGAINTGLDNAVGELIARADADDINRPYRLEIQVEYLNRHPDIFLLGGAYAPFNDNGHRSNVVHPVLSLEIAWWFITNTYFCHPTVIFRREVFQTIGYYPNVEAEDFSYFSMVVRKYRCANLSIVLIDYRETAQNRSNSAADRIARSVRVQAEENYKYYGGNDADFFLFYRYRSGNVLYFKDFVKVLRLNIQMLSRIATIYGKRKFSTEFLYVVAKLLFMDFLLATRCGFKRFCSL